MCVLAPWDFMNCSCLLNGKNYNFHQQESCNCLIAHRRFARCMLSCENIVGTELPTLTNKKKKKRGKQQVYQPELILAQLTFKNNFCTHKQKH